MEASHITIRWLLSIVTIVTLVLTGTSRSQGSFSEWCQGRDLSRYYRHPTDCNAYIICRRGEPPAVLRCFRDLEFDDFSQTCNYKDGVPCHLRHIRAYNSTQYGHSDTRPNSHRHLSVYLRHLALRKDGQHRSKMSSMSFSEKMARVRGEMGYMFPHIRVTRRAFYANQSNMATKLTGHHRPFRHVQGLLGNDMKGYMMSSTAFESLEFLQDIKRRYQLSKRDMRYVTRRLGRLTDLVYSNNRKVRSDMDIDSMLADEDKCPYSEAKTNECDHLSRYRSLDGSCNNLHNPLWGRALMPLKRELQSEYDDGISAPRMLSVSGRRLRGSRQVSWYTMPDMERPSKMLTVMHMTFGQILDHDIGRTAVTMMKSNATGKLVNVECGESGCETDGPENAACMPIPVPKGDPAFEDKKPCLMFVRSQAVLKDDCSLGPREQLNRVTSYLDASHVYGSSLKDSLKLRNMDNPNRGQLRLVANKMHHYRGLLPRNENVQDCRDQTETEKCFLAGDTRVNEQVALSSLHTILHRYHNEIEERLHRLNPRWGGEKLYQETRRIVGAVWQHIVYNEYLPTSLGHAQVKKHGLQLYRHGYYNAYDRIVRADASNAFQTAAFRYGHSQITNVFNLADHTYHKMAELKFSEVFNRPTEVYKNHAQGCSGIDGIILGQVSQRAARSDSFFADQVTTKLFSENPPLIPGTDLPALNIQRGRDHGIPGYLKYRRLCGLRVARSWVDLADMSDSALVKLKRTYDYVQDIDLFVGGMLEDSLEGSLVGPTFACLIGRQFRHLRHGDRFWYERYDPITGFTKAELAEIRKMTLSRIMCDTMDHLVTIQKFALLQPFTVTMATMNASRSERGDAYMLGMLYRDDKNERRPCLALPQMDLSVWGRRPSSTRRPPNYWWTYIDKYNPWS